MSKWRRLQKQKSFKGIFPENYLCIDCGFDTQPGSMNREEAEREANRQIAAGIRDYKLPFTYNDQNEMYIVHPHVWKAAGMEPDGGYLCVGCLEKRIGRRLVPDDFDQDHEFNTILPGTKRLLERQGRYDPLQAALDRAMTELSGRKNGAQST